VLERDRLVVRTRRVHRRNVSSNLAPRRHSVAELLEAARPRVSHLGIGPRDPFPQRVGLGPLARPLAFGGLVPMRVHFH
jgi:hypothetical protein